ncbi:MAG: sigma-54-dependent Fis family transcriptional regulator [Spirochaetales bacterium]|nr:sigma-54-dependent Fis family transcriptional regulator [Spirochaetales bacterium]
MKVMILDDEAELVAALDDFLKLRDDLETATMTDSNGALEYLLREEADLLISDCRMPGLSGIDLAERLSREKPGLRTILVSGEEDIIQSINAFDLGIYDFITKPLDLNRLSAMLDKLTAEKKGEAPAQELERLLQKDKISLEDITLPRELFFLDGKQQFVLADRKMQKLRKKIAKLARFTHIPILIEGPTGSGKEMVARMIHREAGTADAPFVGLNCGAIEGNLFESELFGYEKGAFTGADSQGKPGKIALAEGGTLFLDEITEISQEIQVKLLRVLQEQEYYPVGGSRVKKVKARIVCATNRDIASLVREGLFREDLLYRLDVCKLTIPPLKERPDDILPLIIHGLQEIGRQNRVSLPRISGDALKALRNYDWPGNVRELKNCLTRGVLFSDSRLLTGEDFFPDSAAQVPENSRSPFLLPEEPFDLNRMVEELILQTLEKFDGNKSRAADYLGLDRYQFYRRYRQVLEEYQSRND